MALSEREQELLAQLEKQLNEDSSFASAMTDSQPTVAPTAGASPRHLVLGALVAVVGLGIIIGGVATKLTLLGVLGFVVAAGGVYLATTATSKGSARSGQAAAGAAGSTAKPRSSQFMRNLEDKWDERTDGNRF